MGTVSHYFIIFHPFFTVLSLIGISMLLHGHKTFVLVYSSNKTVSVLETVIPEEIKCRPLHIEYN